MHFTSYLPSTKKKAKIVAGHENNRELRNRYRISAVNREGKNLMGDLHVDDMIILKWFLKEIRYHCFD